MTNQTKLSALGDPCLSTVIYGGGGSEENALTVEVGSEAEDVVSALVLVPEPVIPDARHGVLAPAGLPGLGDGVLHGAVAEPAGVAPVQPRPPGIVELVKGRDHRVLLHARPLRLVEVQVVPPQPRGVGEHHTWSGGRGRVTGR